MRFWGVDRQTDRFAVQAFRADPPRLARGDDDRRQVFGSALEQFDQLLTAADAVGSATAPIPLFYAFSQGGRALAAARVEGSDWRPNVHGLSVGPPGTTIGETVVRPQTHGVGSFQLFCQSIGSSSLTGPATLSALWAAAGRFRCVEGLGAGMPATTDAMVMDEGASGHVVLEGAVAADLPADHEQQQAVMSERLAPYAPGGEGVRVAPSRWPNQTFKVPRVEVYWELEPDVRRPVSEVVVSRITAEGSGFVVVPAVGSQRDVLRPVAAMYATFLALSSLARYHPDAWRRSLDRDAATSAMAIEEAIEITLELLPYSFKEFLTE